MILTTGAEIENSAIAAEISKLINQVYKLLPSREEMLDWESPLDSIIQELSGMDRLLLENHELLFVLLCKLESLFLLINEEDFKNYRKTIFECLNLLSNLKEQISECRV